METKQMGYEDKIIIEKRKTMFYEAFRYLLEKGKDKGITPKDIRNHLKDRENRKPTDINGKNGLFYKMLQHAINRNGNLRRNVIGDFDNLSVTLFNFDPKKVYQKYGSNKESGKNLLDDIEINLNGKDIIRGKGSVWDIFSRSIVSVAEFLSTFNTINEFNNYVDGFNENEDKMIELALIIDKIFGYGFPLACDFLKENCNPNYIKPDIHIQRLFSNNYIVNELKVPIKLQTLNKENKKYNTKDNIEIFRAVRDYSRSIHKQPYKVDKLFYLIGSRDFYLVNKDSGTSMDEFINKTKKKLDSKFHV